MRFGDGGGGTVSAEVHEPEGAGSQTPTVALTHGAGGTRDTPGLVSLGARLAGFGIRVVRFNLPSAEAGRRRPDRPETAVRAIGAVLAALADAYPGPLFAGGRSFGGRMVSLLLADGRNETAALASGAIFLAYPLRPPGRAAPPPDRFEHLPRIQSPMLFVSGSRDPFAPPGTIERAAPAGAIVRIVDGADHGFRMAKAVVMETGRTTADAEAEVADAARAFVTGRSR